jgi:thiol-disulfide isomerase/thioredoxin
MRSFFISLVLFFFTAGAASAQTQRLEITIDGLRNDTCLLAYHFGSRQYIQDTVVADARGHITYTKEEPLQEGIYYLVLPDKQFLEFITDEPVVRLETDQDALIQRMQVKESPENELFYGFLKYSEDKGRKIASLKKELDNTDKSSNKRKRLEAQIDSINKIIVEHKKELIRQHPESFVATFFEASRDPQVPEPKKKANGEVDSTYPYRWYQSHYMDNIDMSDERLLRTPVYHKRMMRYLNKVVPRDPDSLIKAADRLVERASGNEETFKYVVHTITSKYERSKYMGMDKVFVHMVEEYYSTGRATWVDKKNLTKIVQRAAQLKPTLLGKKAPQIRLKNPEGEYKSLYEIDADYTVVYIWDPDCGHCKRATPKLKKIYKKYEPEQVEVFAVNNALEKDKWLEFIEDKKLDWINVADFDYESQYRAYYDVRSTPMIFLLNDEKEVVAKKISVEQLGQLLEQFIKGDKSKS